MRRNLFYGILAIALVSGMTLAGEGRTPIWEPTVITESGVYVVTRDINTPSGTGPTILIQSGLERVEIDLNGFSLAGDPTLSMQAVIQAHDVNEVVVRNGTIVHRSVGEEGAVWISNAWKAVVENITSKNSGGAGIVVEMTAEARVRGNSIHNASAEGIEFTGPSEAVRGTGVVEDNAVWNSDDGIMVENGAGVSIRNNRVTGSVDDGIRIHGCNGCFIVENSVHYIGQRDGISLRGPSEGCEIRENIVLTAAQDGIVVEAHSNLVLQNAVRNCQGDGLRIDGNDNQVERNALMNNGRSGTGWGLHFLPDTSSNFYSRNTGANNSGTAGQCGGPSATNDFCDEGISNVSFGDNRMPTGL